MNKALITLSLAVMASVLSTSALAVSCQSFKTQAQAQQYFNAKKAGYKKLDRDHDGKACECNRGGKGKFCPKKKSKR